MRAIDTNILVRCLIDEDVSQCAAARQFVVDNEVFVPTTVLLETEWVLRSSYSLSLGDISDCLRGFIGLSSVTVENPILIDRVLGLVRQQIDMADAFHVASSRDCEDFVTFDSPLARAATAGNLFPVTLLNTDRA